MPADIQYIIWIVLLAFSVFLNLNGSVTIWTILQNAILSILAVVALWILYAKKQVLVAYFLLFTLSFANQLGTFIKAIFSLNFGTGSFTLFPLSWEVLVGNWNHLLIADDYFYAIGKATCF